MKIVLGLFAILILSSCGSKTSSGSGNNNGRQSVNNVAPIANCQNLNNCQATITNPPPILEFSFQLPNNTTAIYDINLHRKKDSGSETIGSVYCQNGQCQYTPYYNFIPLSGTGDSGSVSTLKLQYNIGIYNYEESYYHLKIIKR